MQGYAAEPDGREFAQSRAYYAELEEWLSGADAVGPRHADLEEQLRERGLRLLRRMHQDHLDLLTAREQRRGDVSGPDGIARTRAEKGHQPAAGYGVRAGHGGPDRLPGSRRADAYPPDAALNLPDEKQSHGLRKLAAAESARGSYDDAAAAITRATGVKAGKRQVEQRVRRAAADIDAFYASRWPGTRMITCWC